MEISLPEIPGGELVQQIKVFLNMEPQPKANSIVVPVIKAPGVQVCPRPCAAFGFSLRG